MLDNKNILLILLVLSLLLSLITVFVVAEGGIPAVSAKSSVLFEPVTKSFLYEKNADMRLPMASTTKIMTALLAIERLDLDEVVVIPKEATGIEGSSIYLNENDEIKVCDLIYSVLLQSANDAATALAIKISGDTKTFADEMNERAKQLGLNDTSFENPHGLDSQNHYTTAHDLAVIASEALSNDVFKEICSTYKHSFYISEAPRTVVNHNKMLKKYKGANGVKTGYTDRSGRCLVSSAERDGITMIAVTLNASDDWNDHKRLLDFGFERFEPVYLHDLAPTEYKIPVEYGKESLVDVRLQNDCITIPHDKAKASLSTEIILPTSLTAPIEKNSTVGRVDVKQDDRTIASFPLITVQNVKAEKSSFNLFDFFKDIF